ncbi:MAG: hypothetical protein LBI53_05795 [Candidatus Peribacteria bacterium]|jgi:hypothetical protein|nr:hypothetical protein [Candidatus Peribacteria bacterium]
MSNKKNNLVVICIVVVLGIIITAFVMGLINLILPINRVPILSTIVNLGVFGFIVWKFFSPLYSLADRIRLLLKKIGSDQKESDSEEN